MTPSSESPKQGTLPFTSIMLAMNSSIDSNRAQYVPLKSIEFAWPTRPANNIMSATEW